MKGNIGLFISAGLDITGKNIIVNIVDNKGNKVGNSEFKPIKPEKQSKLGSSSSGILFTGSQNIYLYNTKISNIYSDQGINIDKTFVGTNKNIVIN